MEQALLQRFQQLIATHTGLHIREPEGAALGKTLAGRTRALQLAAPEQYYQLLQSGGAPGEAEWKQLIVLLTNQESYFFRDKGQFALLQERILPELIKANGERRTLRLWSAGCSTGEEPFSLAMLIDRLLPQREGWNILILGTDIKEAALEKARRAVYSPWSFRLVEPALQKRYFQEQGAEYRLEARIRGMVTFRQGNLFKDEFPNAAAGLSNIDLILCRNVFIYFKPNAVSVVLDKLARTLRNGGYLMTGHTELNAHHDSGQLQVRELPGSIIYQRLNDATAATKPTQTSASSINATVVPLTTIVSRLQQTPQIATPSTHTANEQSAAQRETALNGLPNLLEEAQTLIRNRAHSAAAEKLKNLLRAEPQNYVALCLLAQAYANLGRHDEAADCCRQAISIDAFAPLPYSLLAHIAEEQGDIEEARNLLKKVIYLAPSFAPAYLELGALYEKEGDTARAQKMRTTALELLQSLIPNAVVEPYGLTSQELIRQLK
ncbi:MAG TPA: CheR family methyltransferase [Abditibacteriaceae bacterium]|jgi:chemotaxis protein methyltransferase CheR